MKITIQTKLGKKFIFDTEDTSNYSRLDSDIFLLMEKIWWEWYEEESEHNREIEAMYFSDEACWSKVGAIKQGVELLVEIAEESNKTFFTESDIWNADIECAFC